jgi:hypothetical protein
VQMRAFVTSSSVNIDPSSEATVQLVLEEITRNPGNSLGAFTSREIEDLVASIDMLTAANGSGAAGTANATAESIKTLANAKPEIKKYLAASAGAGQTADAPGDIGNYFPLTTGNRWTYQETGSDLPGPIQRTFAISGTRVLRGTTVFVMGALDSTPAARVQETYYAKSGAGLIFHGTNDPAAAAVEARTAPYVRLKLPSKIDETVTAIDQRDLSTNEDLDGDGAIDSFSTYSVSHAAKGYESVTVPAGTFRCLKVELQTHTLLTTTSSKVTTKSDDSETWWLAPGIGLVKRAHAISVRKNEGTTTTTIRNAELVDANVGGIAVPRRSATAP